VWREKDGWIGPFKLLVNDGETCTIDMLYKPTNFRLIVVKLYYSLPEAPQEDKKDKDGSSEDDTAEQSVREIRSTIEV
jgi:hypothetical protein